MCQSALVTIYSSADKTEIKELIDKSLLGDICITIAVHSFDSKQCSCYNIMTVTLMFVIYGQSI